MATPLTDKTDSHDIPEILLKVALNTVNPNPFCFITDVDDRGDGIQYEVLHQTESGTTIVVIDTDCLTFSNCILQLLDFFPEENR
jgi:hypothetical protein